jgi:hypothetical protein
MSGSNPLPRDAASFASAKTARVLKVASRPLLEALVQFTLDPSVRAIETARTIDIPGERVSSGEIVLLKDDGRWLLELIDGGRPRNREEEAFVHLARSRLGLPLLRVTSADLGRQPFASNCREVWGCRNTRVAVGDRVRILQALEEERTLGLIDAGREMRFARDPIAAVLALACADLVELDLVSARLGPDTRVARRAPPDA